MLRVQQQEKGDLFKQEMPRKMGPWVMLFLPVSTTPSLLASGGSKSPVSQVPESMSVLNMYIAIIIVHSSGVRGIL